MTRDEMPHRRAGQGQARAERRISGEHRRRRQMAFEPRRQPARDDMVVHHVSDRRRRGRSQGYLGDARLAADGVLEKNRPEQRARMMDGVSDGRVPERRFRAAFGPLAPNPMAGRIARGARGARAAPSEIRGD